MLWWFAQTTLIAGGLAVLATLGGRWKRLGPEARHALWLVVLIKLALPPVVAWPWGLPDTWPARVEPAQIASTAPTPTPPVVEVASPTPEVEILPEPPAPLDLPAIVAQPPSPEEVHRFSQAEDLPAPQESQTQISKIPDLKSQIQDLKSEIPDLKSEIPDLTPRPQVRQSAIWTWKSALLALWLAGSVVVVARRGIKIFRFHRSLAGSQPAPDWLAEEVREIGERVGVRPPPILAAPSIGTPLLWCLGRPRLILPEALIKRLDADRWSGILAHELAHLARRDHWVVRLELLVEAVWWWNPLFWHARRRLHEEAELACDARVIRSLPERRFAYAEALVDVCEHLARTAIPSPSLGVGGAGASRSLEGRLLMILRDPIPRRPSRRATLAALFLVALALPAWTLGQQPDEPKPKADAPASKPDAPKAESSRPDATPAPAALAEPLKPDPALANLSLEEVLSGFKQRRESLKSLAMRYVVTSRSEAARGESKICRVQIEAADVSYQVHPAREFQPDRRQDESLSYDSRLDVFETKPVTLPKPGETGSANPWSRWLEIRTGEDAKSLQFDSSSKAAARFRWQALGRFAPVQMGGPPLNLLFTRDSSLLAGSVLASAPATINRPDIRPLVLLDFEGPSTYLIWQGVKANVAGVETIGGRQAVRVAWIEQGQSQVRGICWLAPSLGFAVVRSEAFIDGPRESEDPSKRWVWRKSAEDFTHVGPLWLPGKVTVRLSAAYPDGKTTVVRDQIVALEDYRVNAELPEDLFEGKFPIQGIDEKSGDFTTTPPEPAPGLIARLERAVKESKFGPPVDEKIVEQPKFVEEIVEGPKVEEKIVEELKFDERAASGADLSKYNPVLLRMVQEDLGFYANTNVPAPIRSQVVREFHADPEVVPILKQLIPVLIMVATIESSGLKSGQAELAQLKEQKASLIKAYDRVWKTKSKAILVRVVTQPISAPDRWVAEELTIERELRMNPQMSQALAPVRSAEKKVADASQAAKGPNDPALIQARQDLDEAQTRFLEAYETLRIAIKNRIAAAKDIQAKGKPGEANRPRDPIALVPKPDKDAAKADPGIIAKPVPGFEDPIPVTNPKVEDPIPVKNPADQAALDQEVVNLSKQMIAAQSKLEEIRRITRDPTDPAARKAQQKLETLQAKFAKLREDKSKEISRQEGSHQQTLLLQARDEVELLSFRRDGKAAEVKKAEAQLELANSVWKRAQTLFTRNAISQGECDDAKAGQKVAEAELARKKSELDEAELYLKQAKRRVDPSSSPIQPPQLPGLDSVDVLQIRRDAKAAEVAKAEAQRKLAESGVNHAQAILKAGKDITQEAITETETRLKIAEAEVASKKAELAEAEALLGQARRRVGPSDFEPKAAKVSTVAPSGTLPELREAVELLEAQLQGKQAELRGAESKAARANRELQYTKKLADQKSVSQTEVALYEDSFQATQADADSKKAEVLEFEIRVKQAKRRAEAEEARLKREVGRLKARLEWFESMFKKGFASKEIFEADQAAYDGLMLQLDPKYVPAQPSTEPSAKP